MGEGNGGEIELDYDRLNRVYDDLTAQKDLVQSLNFGEAPSPSVFGGSPRAQHLAGLVTRGHEGVMTSKKETAQALDKYASAVDDARNNIIESDEGAAMVARKMADALDLISRPLIFFDPETGGKRPMAV